MERIEDLVVAARTGDHAAYSRIVERFEHMALSYAYSILGDWELAEDVRQEAFLKAWCDLMSLREPAAFPGWLRQIVRTHSINVVRGRRGLLVPLEDAAELAANGPRPDEIVEQQLTQERLRRAIAQLPVHESGVTQRFYLDHCSLQEIGREYGIPAKTVKSRLHAARARLRQRLMEMVKKTVHTQNPASRRQAMNDASLTAIVQFDAELQHLLKVPGEAEVRRAGVLICAKGRLQRFMGRHDEALAAFESALASPLLKRDAALCLRLRAEIGLTRIQTADYAAARKALRGVLAATQRIEQGAALRAAVLNGLGQCCWGEGKFRQAREFYQEAVKASREADCEELETEGLNNLALLDWKDGQLEPALAGFELCLKRWRRLRNRFGQALNLMNAAIIEENLGRPIVARRHYQEALRLAKTINFVQVQSATHGNLANLSLGQGNWTQALEHSQRALELARGIRDRRSVAIALENQALAVSALGRHDDVAPILREARAIAATIGDRERVFSLDLVEIEDLLAQGLPGGVMARIERAWQCLERNGFASERPRLLRLQAQAVCLEDGASEGGKVIEQALQECQKQKNRVEEARVLQLARQMGAGLSD